MAFLAVQQLGSFITLILLLLSSLLDMVMMFGLAIIEETLSVETIQLLILMLILIFGISVSKN
jgi:hypothetical protein